MQIGEATIDGMMVGIVEINLSSETEILPDYVPSEHMEHEDSSVRLGHQHGYHTGAGHEPSHSSRLGHKHGFHTKSTSGEQASGGSYGRTGGDSGANFLGSARARAAGIESGPNENLTTVDTKAGKITVNRSAASDMTGAVNDLVEAGAPVGHIGSHADRNIAGSSRKSQHAYGGAMDLFNQSGRGIISREGMNWIKANPDKWREIKQKRNLVGGEEFGDIGHVEWGGPGYGERHYGGAASGQRNYGPGAPGEITNKTTPGVPVRGSYFDDRNTATGLSAATTPGIALPSREGLGKMHEVTGPGGQKVMLPQIDVGPAKWTGRGIDISKAAMEKFGYHSGNFPTDANFSYRRADQPKPEPMPTQTEPM